MTSETTPETSPESTPPAPPFAVPASSGLTTLVTPHTPDTPAGRASSDESRTPRATAARHAARARAAERSVARSRSLPASGTLTSDEWCARLQGTLESFDEAGGHRTLSALFDSVPLDVALADVVLPYLHGVGSRWETGDIGVAQEHFASSVIRTRLSLTLHHEMRSSGPLAVLACMPGEKHEFGLMAMALVLSRLGWRTCYLGADTPTADVALAVGSLGPDAVVLTSHRSTAFTAKGALLRRMSEQTTVYVAGPGATDDPREVGGARHLPGDPVTGARTVDGQWRAVADLVASDPMTDAVAGGSGDALVMASPLASTGDGSPEAG